MKLNTLVYFAQAWALAKHGCPLSDEEAQAWAYGPVIPSIYHTFKKYGYQPISATSGKFNADKLTSEEIELLGDVYLKYGNFRPTDLVWKTHEAGSPWRQVYVEEKHDIVIPKKLIGEYYGSRPDELEVPPVDLDKIPRIGHWDADGVRVLPADMDCPEDDIFNQMYAKG